MEIVFEDNHLLIVNKKPGQLSQSDKTGDQSILELCKNYIKLKYNKKGNVFLGLVNRIDRPTSGLLILAKTSKSLERMNKILKNREIKKTYVAITEKNTIKKSGRLINFLKKNEKKNKSFVVNKETKGSFIDNKISFSGKNNIIGRSIIVHDLEDDLGKGGDEESLKTGNAGARLNCAKIYLL